MYKYVAGQLQILMIEDRYGKWTLPKGKQEAGETLRETALREIWEETGIKGSVVTPITIIHYQFKKSEGTRHVDKEVHYYLVQALSGTEKPQLEEINRVQWFPTDVAWDRQLQSGYDNNNYVLERALQFLNQ